MKRVTLRQFMRQGSEFVDTPTEIEQKGKLIGVFLPVDYYAALTENPEGGGPPADRSPKNSREVQTVVEPLAEVGQVVSEKAEIPREQIWEDRNFMPVTAQIGFGFCQTHFERKQQKTWFVSAEDGTGKVLTDKKWVCETCLKKMVSGIALNGGRIVQI